MELPVTLFEFYCCKVLLIGLWLEIESKEETFKIHSLEIGLPIVHGRSREVSVNGLLCYQPFLVFDSLVEPESIIYWERILKGNHILVLNLRNVLEGTVYHIK